LFVADGILQGAGDGFLSNDSIERNRTVFPGRNNKVFHELRISFGKPKIQKLSTS
jgi:hypothetical protein